MTKDEKILTVSETPGHIGPIEIFTEDKNIKPGDVIVLQQNERQLSAVIGDVRQSSSDELRLFYWQREFLNVNPGDSVRIRFVRRENCPPAQQVTVAVSSYLYSYDQQVVRKTITEQLEGLSVLPDEPKQIEFVSDTSQPEAKIFILEVQAEETPALVQQPTTLIEIKAIPLAKLMVQLRELVYGALEEKSWEKTRDVQEVMAEIGKRVDEAAGQNLELRAQLEQAIAPALKHGILVGPSSAPEAEPDEYVIGTSEGRFTAKLIETARVDLSALQQGLEVQLNQERNIVGIYGSNRRGEAAEVVNLLHIPGQVDGPPTQLQVRLGGVDMVVDCGEEIQHADPPVEIGDLVRIDPLIKLAFEKMSHHETGELELEQVPDVTYDDIGGLGREIQHIRDAIELPYLHLDLYKQFNLDRPKGILLYGPPGCGKTMIAKAMANGLIGRIRKYLEDKRQVLDVMLDSLMQMKSVGKGKQMELYREALAIAIETCLKDCTVDNVKKQLQEFLDGSNLSLATVRTELEQEIRQAQSILDNNQITSYFLNVKGPELLTKWVGETELKIRKVFEKAKKQASFNTPVVVFFDEMEALFRKRGSGISSDIELTIVPQFLSEMDGVEEYGNIIIVGATNRHDLLDPAVKRAGRLDVKVFIGRPGRDQARDIFTKYFYPWRPQEPDRSLPLSPEERGEHDSPGAMVDRMIDEALAVIYNDRNLLRVTTHKGQEFTYPLRDFVSGALIRAIVARASHFAIKGTIDSSSPAGITLAMFRQAVLEEFAQNKDHLIENIPELEEESFDIELEISEVEPRDKWEEPKQRPYLWREPNR